MRPPRFWQLFPGLKFKSFEESSSCFGGATCELPRISWAAGIFPVGTFNACWSRAPERLGSTS